MEVINKVLLFCVNATIYSYDNVFPSSANSFSMPYPEMSLLTSPDFFHQVQNYSAKTSLHSAIAFHCDVVMGVVTALPRTQ